MTILDLHRQGLSASAIARQLGRDRKTLRKYIARGLHHSVVIQIEVACASADLIPANLRTARRHHPADASTRSAPKDQSVQPAIT